MSSSRRAPIGDPSATVEDRALGRLLGEIRACRVCRDAPRGAPLPHEPRPVLQASAEARLLITGQAPGTRVHASGRPFTDPSGDRLRAWLGIGPDVFYDARRVAIVPMGFCFPGLDAHGSDLPPRVECAPRWRARVLAALPRVTLMVLVGRHAHAWHLPDQRRSSLTETVRAGAACLASWRHAPPSPSPLPPPLPPPVLPRTIALPHPSWRNNAWLKRNPWFEPEILMPLREEIARLV